MSLTFSLEVHCLHSLKKQIKAFFSPQFSTLFLGVNADAQVRILIRFQDCWS
jgi:hypothetical protein